MEFIDTHCHIHSQDYPLPVDEVEQRAVQAAVTKLICVGTDAEDSRRAVAFAQSRPYCWASVGLHPHEAKEGEAALRVIQSLLVIQQDSDSSTTDPRLDNRAASEFTLASGDVSRGSAPSPAALRGRGGADETAGPEGFAIATPRVLPLRAPSPPYSLRSVRWGLPPTASPVADARHAAARLSKRESVVQEKKKIIAIGECGLDYFYGHSSKRDQEKALRFQIELAFEYNLPLIFHVRDAFDDFWSIFDSYTGLRGVVHSFTDTRQHLDNILERGLYVGMNGIITFTKNDWQLENARHIPLDRLVLETDAPFLTPVPLRGKVNEPAHVLCTAEFLAKLRGETLENLAQSTTLNTRQLFSI